MTYMTSHKFVLYIYILILTHTHDPVLLVTITSYKNDKEKRGGSHLLLEKIGVAFSVLFLLLVTASDC